MNSHQAQWTKAESRFLYNRVAPQEVVAEPIDCCQQPGRFLRASRRSNAQKYDAGNRPSLTKYQVAKILVFRQQQPVFAVCATHHGRIGRTWRYIGHIDDVVPRFAQQQTEGRSRTFIDQPPHTGQP